MRELLPHLTYLSFLCSRFSNLYFDDRIELLTLIFLQIKYIGKPISRSEHLLCTQRFCSILYGEWYASLSSEPPSFKMLMTSTNYQLQMSSRLLTFSYTFLRSVGEIALQNTIGSTAIFFSSANVRMIINPQQSKIRTNGIATFSEIEMSDIKQRTVKKSYFLRSR